MSLEKAKADLEQKGFLDHVRAERINGHSGRGCGGTGCEAGNDCEDHVLFTG